MKLPKDEYADLDLTDAQMFRFVRILKARGIIRFLQEFWDAIGVLKQNARNIKNGSQHFTAEQITAACNEYNGNANFIHGLERNPFRSGQYYSEDREKLEKIGQNGVGARSNVKPAANTAANKRAQKSNI